jgi:hypothetical protein
MAESYDPSAGGKVDIKSVPKPEASKAIIRSALQGAAAFLFSSLSAAENETVRRRWREGVRLDGRPCLAHLSQRLCHRAVAHEWRFSPLSTAPIPCRSLWP